MQSWKGALLGALAVTIGAAHAEGSKRYLIEFQSPATFRTMSERFSLSSRAPGVVAPMHLFNHADTVVSETLNKIEMVVVESANVAAMEILKRHPAVALVEEEVFHPAPEPLATFGSRPVTVTALPLETPWGIGAVKAPGAWNVTRGQGARVMVLDTGLDVGHPALAGRFVKGQNFTGGDRADIRDNVGHGTHVSGTILADGLRGGLVGVAPEAQLMMGKVCSDRGCSSVAIASGINWAVTEGAQVVNMSLGGAFITDAEARALQRAEQAGVLVVAASGNDGTDNVSYPAATPSVIAVGAIDSTRNKAEFSQWGPELDVVAPGVEVVSSVPRGTGRDAEVSYGAVGAPVEVLKSLPFQGSPVAAVSGENVVFAGFGRRGDFSGVDVNGKIVLLSRGEIPFKEKSANAIQRGATGVLIYNNAPGLARGSLTDDGSEVAVPVVMIEQTAGETLKNLLTSGGKVNLAMQVEASDYAALQGTSMATPHVAGVAALVRAANPALTPAQVRDILNATATPLGPNDENQYGHGLVDAEAAVAKALALAPVAARQAAL